MILFLTCLREIREFSLQFNVNIFIWKSGQKKDLGYVQGPIIDSFI